MRRIKLFHEIFESEDTRKGGIYFVELDYNYPSDSSDSEDEDGDEDIQSFDTGGYGRFYIDLSDPTKYFVSGSGENSDVSYYIDEGIIKTLKEYGSAPYSGEDLEDQSVVNALDNLYAEDCRTGGAYLDVYVIRTNIDPKEFSKFMEILEIPEEYFISREEYEGLSKKTSSEILIKMKDNGLTLEKAISKVWDGIDSIAELAALADLNPDLTEDEREIYKSAAISDKRK